MASRIRSHFAHNVVGYVALVFAISGTAYAGVTITSADIQDNTIEAADIHNGAIESTDLAAGLMPKVISTSQTSLEFPTEDTMAPVMNPLTLKSGRYRYLVVATFGERGDIPFECTLLAGRGDQVLDQQRVDKPAFDSREMVGIVAPGSAPATASLLCADKDPSKSEKIVNARITAIRFSSG